MTTKQKIGIAAACLVAIGAIIAWDQRNLRKGDAPEPIATPVTLQTALTPSASPTLPPPAPKPEEPIAVPKDCAQESVDQKQAGPASDKELKPVPAASKDPERVYTVVQGDSLYGISMKVYGTARHYERIYEANRDRIKDPNTLQIGINLRMPDASARPAAQ